MVVFQSGQSRVFGEMNIRSRRTEDLNYFLLPIVIFFPFDTEKVPFDVQKREQYLCVWYKKY